MTPRYSYLIGPSGRMTGENVTPTGINTCSLQQHHQLYPLKLRSRSAPESLLVMCFLPFPPQNDETQTTALNTSYLHLRTQIVHELHSSELTDPEMTGKQSVLRQRVALTVSGIFQGTRGQRLILADQQSPLAWSASAHNFCHTEQQHGMDDE